MYNSNNNGYSELLIDRKGMSGSTLKIIALISMFIDHIGAVIIERILLNENNYYLEQFGLLNINILYIILRAIGRIAFPIFCFLLVEGLKYTKNKRNYALRLLIFAFLSEIPFNLAVKNSVFNFEYQNIFFTLFIGLVVLIVLEHISAKKVLKVILSIGVIVIGMILAQVLHTDYGAIGIFCIAMLFVFQKSRLAQVIAGCVSFAWELTASFAFVLIAFYNGDRGIRLKYFFYIFYPMHLLFLYFVAWKMNLV